MIGILMILFTIVGFFVTIHEFWKLVSDKSVPLSMKVVNTLVYIIVWCGLFVFTCVGLAIRSTS